MFLSRSLESTQDDIVEDDRHTLPGLYKAEVEIFICIAQAKSEVVDSSIAGVELEVFIEPRCFKACYHNVGERASDKSTCTFPGC